MAIRLGHYHTYQDWLDADHDKHARVELIDGVIYLFAAPARRHQAVVREMSGQLFIHLRGKSCKVYTGPIAVRLEKNSVVEPDIVVVCDPKKLTKSGIEGTPDLIIEILSPSNARHDKITKLNLYQRTGVAEYWIVDPSDNTLTTYNLLDGRYVVSAYDNTGTATVNALPGFEMDLSAVLTDEDEAEEN